MFRHLTRATTVGLALLVTGCSPTPPSSEPDRPDISAGAGIPDWAMKLIPALPARVESPANPLTDAKIELGRRLYFDSLLSATGDASCNSCHPLESWGTAGRRTTAGDWCRLGRRDAPSVYNAAVQTHLFWDGRATSVEEQVKETLLSPMEMGHADEAAVVTRVRAIGDYQNGFRAAFPSEQGPITFDNVAKALGAFERTLLTPSRWDRFVQGDEHAITEAEKRGFVTFVAKGCSDCHNGVGAGGRMYQVLGEAAPWPEVADSGRFFVTGKAADVFVFKVPSLRNVAKTGPYFHYDLVGQLPAAVRMMARYQRRLTLSEEDVAAIVTWLNTLTGELPKEFASVPPPR